MSPKRRKRVRFSASTVGETSVSDTPTVSDTNLDVTKILDIHFKKGKQYLAEINDGVVEPQWIGHRKLHHVRHLIEAFHEQRDREQDAIIDSDREPDQIFGYTRDPVTQEGMFLIKWRLRHDCSLVRASRLYAKYPALAIAWFEKRLRSNAMGEEEAGMDQLFEACSAVAETSSWTESSTTLYTSVNRNENPAEIVGALYENNQLLFLMRWEDCEDTEFVLAAEANQMCPQIVLRFYESRIEQ